MSGRWSPRNTTLHQKALHRAVYNDWGLYQFVQMLEYKCVLAQKTLEHVDERESSKRCSRCGHTQPMPLYQRTYRCQNGGLVLDRDENSAVTHYQRFFARLPSTHGRSRAVCGCIHRNRHVSTRFGRQRGVI